MSSIYPLVAALLANVIAQVLKPIVLYFRTKELDVHQCIACGGFPSSHSSTVTALTIAIGMNEGFDSALFAITCVFSFIVIYDAANVRYYAGRNIQLTKQLISDLETLKGLKFNDPIYHEKIKSVLGHKFIEILGGILLSIRERRNRMQTKIDEIKQTIEKIRPYIQRDGGDVEFVSFEDGIVGVRLLGACVGCMSIDDTIQGGIEAILLDEVEGVSGVALIE